MSYGKTMEEVMASAHKAPTELSYDEVEFLFLNPTPPPPARPWWRGGSLKFLLMIAFIATLIGLLLPPRATVADYQLSAFPVQEETPTYTPAEALKIADELTALPVPKIETPAPHVRVSAPQPAIAPAAAPAISENVPATQETKEDPPVTVRRTGQPDRSAVLPPALFTGEYSLGKDHLMLGFTLTPNGQKNLLFFDITEEERRSVKNADGTLSIKRAAGSLLLYPNGKDGRFEFLPDPEYQARMTAKHWGPGGASGETASFITATEGKAAPGTTNSDKRAKDQLWFRYFTNNIDERYTGLLQRAGYTSNDLTELWELANWYVSYDDLNETLELTSAVLTDLPPLTELSSLHHKIEYLQELRRNGEKLSFEDFSAFSKNISLWESMRKNKRSSASGTPDKEVTKRERDLNFSTNRPGSTSITLGYTFGEKLILDGNFDYRFTKDPARKDITVFGPEKAIKKLGRNSDYDQLELVNKNKKEPLFVEVPLGVHLLQKTGKGSTVEIKTKIKN